MRIDFDGAWEFMAFLIVFMFLAMLSAVTYALWVTALTDPTKIL